MGSELVVERRSAKATFITTALFVVALFAIIVAVIFVNVVADAVLDLQARR